MITLVASKNISIIREDINTVSINFLYLGFALLFDNYDIVEFKEYILSIDYVQLIDKNFIKLKSDTWRCLFPTPIIDELRICLELAPVDELVSSDFKTIYLGNKEDIPKENQKKDENVINFQIESAKRRHKK